MRPRFLAQLEFWEGGERANASYPRQLLTEMGDVLLRVPSSRNWNAAERLQANRRRSGRRYWRRGLD